MLLLQGGPYFPFASPIFHGPGGRPLLDGCCRSLSRACMETACLLPSPRRSIAAGAPTTDALSPPPNQRRETPAPSIAGPPSSSCATNQAEHNANRERKGRNEMERRDTSLTGRSKLLSQYTTTETHRSKPSLTSGLRVPAWHLHPCLPLDCWRVDAQAHGLQCLRLSSKSDAPCVRA